MPSKAMVPPTSIAMFLMDTFDTRQHDVDLTLNHNPLALEGSLPLRSSDAGIMQAMIAKQTTVTFLSLQPKNTLLFHRSAGDKAGRVLRPAFRS